MGRRVKYINGDKVCGFEFIKEANIGGHPRECVFKCNLCGNEFITRLSSIKNGNTRSCGCLHKSELSERTRIHGGSNTLEFSSWQNMKNRCYNKKTTRYQHYGGRGINVCARWLNSFEAFILDMGKRPAPKYTLERINNDKDYCKENCRWATKKDQNRNRSITIYVSLDGIKRPLSELIEYYGLNEKTVRTRLRRGADVNKAFNNRLAEFNNVFMYKNNSVFLY